MAQPRQDPNAFYCNRMENAEKKFRLSNTERRSRSLGVIFLGALILFGLLFVGVVDMGSLSGALSKLYGSREFQYEPEGPASLSDFIGGKDGARDDEPFRGEYYLE